MKATRYIVLSLMLGVTLGMNARIFDQGERLYINMEAQSVKDAGGDLQYGWYATTHNYNYAYFFTGSTGAWSSQVKQYQGSVWYVEAPAGDWEYVILTRHSSANPGWGTKTYQTGDIWFYYYEGGEKKMREQNYIQNFYYNDGGDKNGANWEYVAPAPSGNPSSWAYEDEQICKEAAGTQYLLQARNYDYDNTYAHSWFKYENNTWTRLDQSEWYTHEDRDHIAIEVTLGGVNSDVYYFLQAARPSMCRLIRVRINQDCADGAPGACKITSFAAVAADANVTDKTSAVNGVVAFDDKKNAGKLQIWSPGVDTLIIENGQIETPQTFRLRGFDASSKKTYTLYTKFLEGSGCEATCQVSVAPPALDPKTHTTTGTAADERLTRFTEEDVTLTPDDQTSTYFMWTNSANNDTVIGSVTDNRNITFDAPAEASAVNYYFLATNDPPTPEGNLITNGTFETKDNLESKYDYWGTGDGVNNYYDTHTGAAGGYAIVKDSYLFYHSYNSVKAHEGEYFGLFDSKVTDDMEEQAAWIARTGDKNPKLKVQAGVSYLFSFWVANINAFYQMNNGARLQFQISYNGGSTWTNLGGEINLGDYKDNRWHGLSSIATPATSSTNVALRVINKNTSNRNIGNDFALDDIRFEAITASTSNIAGYEVFPVRYIACVINGATFSQRQPAGCGVTVADVDYTVYFTNPRGDLYIYEGTTLLAQIPHSDIGDNTTSYTGVLKDQPVDNADHTLTVYFDDGHVKTDAPAAYVYNARAVPAVSVKSLEWGAVACDAATATLTAVITYTNQNGSLSADVDGGASVAGSFTADSDEEQEATLVIPGVAADGSAAHLLNVRFSGSHGCSIIGHALPEAPVTPGIDTARIAFTEPVCTDLTTTLTFDLEYIYQQGTLTYWVDGLAKQTAAYTAADKTKRRLEGLSVADIPADGKNTHVLHVAFDGENSCTKAYTLPAVPFSPVISSVAVSGVPATVLCDATDYAATVTVTTPYDASGRTIVLTYDDNGAQSRTVAATGTQTTVSLTLHTIDGAPQTVTAAYEATPACTTESDGFTPPVRTGCVKEEATVCEGESYLWQGTEYTRPVGIDTITGQTNVHDTLILTVRALPRIETGTVAMTCDLANEIRVPFTVTAGNPDTYSLSVGGTDFAGAADNGEIVFPLPQMAAGDYTAVVTVSEAASGCESTANASFTIALSNQMFSKWTDVLFVSNKDGRYASYQWYADGAEMPGETQQRLYDPAGLSGTTTLYHCRLTTTDGKTLYTCPQTFDEVTPSRTVTTEQPAQIIGVYDTMGRRVSGTPAKGIYITVSEQNGERITTKTIIHE